MKSVKYIKHRRSKHKFPTTITRGHGNTKGRVNKGADRALSDIEKKIGRSLEIAKTGHTKGEWVFCELRKQS